MIQVFNQYVSAKSFVLMVVEASLIVLSLICAVELRFWNNPAEVLLYLSLPDFAVQTTVVVFVCLACFYYNDLYALSTGYSAVERVLRVEQSLGAASLLLGLLYFLFPGLLLGRGVFIIGMVLVTALVVLSRKLLDKAWQFTAPMQRVVILGTGQLAPAPPPRVDRWSPARRNRLRQAEPTPCRRNWAPHFSDRCRETRTEWDCPADPRVPAVFPASATSGPSVPHGESAARG